MTPRGLRLICGAMGAGIVVLCAGVVFVHMRSDGRVPSGAELRTVNALTTAAMAAALAGIIGSEWVWKAMRRDGDAAAAKAFLLRTALREAAALPGLVAALFGASTGVKRVYPAYWVDLVPAAFFLSYLYLQWPSDESLR